MDDPVIEWHPSFLFSNSAAHAEHELPRLALVVLNQPLKITDAVTTLWDNAIVRVAADGGANRLFDLIETSSQNDGERQPQKPNRFEDLDLIIGDLDSLLPNVREFYRTRTKPVTIIHDRDQESTDYGKAIAWIRSNQPSGVDIVALGGLGGRVDQGLSQLHHLYLYQKDHSSGEGRLFLVSEESVTFVLRSGKHRICVRDGGKAVFGKHVGIIPIQGPSIITTRGLEWDVENWKTEFGGRISTSNHVLPNVSSVEVETTKDVVFTIAFASTG